MENIQALGVFLYDMHNKDQMNVNNLFPKHQSKFILEWVYMS